MAVNPASTSLFPTRTRQDQILQFGEFLPVVPDPTTPPRFASTPAITPLPAETVTRPLALIEASAIGFDAEGDEVDGRPRRSSASLWTAF